MKPDISEITVYFNGACGICGPEVAYYARLAERHGRDDIRFVDVSDAGNVPEGFAQHRLLQTFHVCEGAAWRVGVDGFIVLWARLPYFKYLAAILRLPLIHGGASMVYNKLLAPALYKRFQSQQ